MTIKGHVYEIRHHEIKVIIMRCQNRYFAIEKQNYERCAEIIILTI